MEKNNRDKQYGSIGVYTYKIEGVSGRWRIILPQLADSDLFVNDDDFHLLDAGERP